MDKVWLEKVTIAYKVYAKILADQGFNSTDVEHFVTWLYKQYGIVEPKDTLIKNESLELATDMTGLPCEQCTDGSYEETSIHDDHDGLLHCNKCNHETRRWKNINK